MTYTTTYTAPQDAGTYTHPACPPRFMLAKTYTQTYTTYTRMDLHAREGLLIDPLVCSGAQGWEHTGPVQQDQQVPTSATERT